MKTITSLRVRKQIQDNGRPRYRFSIGRKDLSFRKIKDLSDKGTLNLIFSDTFSSADVLGVKLKLKEFEIKNYVLNEVPKYENATKTK